ncbi:MAG: transposase [Candidatus Eisenbacteria bacterium]|nr:transposase [Candidatus Eisenbacteria bacterium]
MPKYARLVLPGVPHHVTQRGNRRVAVFADEKDHRLYLDLLQIYSSRNGLDILAYCLMPNHVHLVAVPREPHSLGRALRDTHRLYARKYNKRYDHAGHLWQGRFFSTPLDDHHFWAAIRYVERNPVRAGMVGRAEDYPWSSARAHCGKTEAERESRRGRLLSFTFPEGSRLQMGGEWSAWLSGEDEEKALDEIRKRTLTGR